MANSQEGFDQALKAAQWIIKDLAGEQPLEDRAAMDLQRHIWGLEALAALLRMEIARRDKNDPIDLA